MKPLAFGAALAAGLALAGEVVAAPRVMSVDSCADQYVIALSPRDAIVGVSARADDPDSYMREQARGLPQRRATTETVLALRPDVVVRYWGGDARLSEALTRRGITVVRIEDAQDFDQVRANVRAVAAALDQGARGETLIAEMDARLARSSGAWAGKPAMYLTPTGYSSGGGTLIDAMLRAAGLTNLVSGPAWEPIPLEAIVRSPPSAFVLGFFSRLSNLTTRWGPGRHAVLRERLPTRTIASLPGAQIGCPAWFVAEGVETLARAAPPGDAMSRLATLPVLAALLLLSLVLAVLAGETGMSASDYRAALLDPASPAAEILWSIRAPRAAMAALVGAALGLAGAALQGLLRNPLADPGVLGVSASAGLGAGLTISLGLAAVPLAIEGAALGGALACGLLVTALAARFRTPEALILMGVSLSAFAGALSALVYNFAASPIMATEVLTWMMGSVANRDWPDALTALGPMAVGAALVAWSARGLKMLALGEETAALSGLPMARLRAAAVAGAALLAGASVAASGVIGFVGLVAPHLVRRSVGDDPARTLAPSALAGAILLVLADLAARIIPTEQELKLGVVTALFGAPVFALVAWRAARSWRS